MAEAACSLMYIAAADHGSSGSRTYSRLVSGTWRVAESGEMADGGALQPTGTGGDVLMRKHRTREKSLSREGPKLPRRRPSTTHVKFP